MSKVFVVAGQPASGKSEFSKALSQHLGITWIDFDDEVAALIAANKDLIAKIGMEDFLKTKREERYSKFITKSAQLLTKNGSLVLSAPFTSEVLDQDSWNKRFAPIKNSGVEIKLLWIHTDPELRKKRMGLRGEERDTQKASSYNFTSITPAVEHIDIDGAGDFSAIVRNFYK